MNKGGDVCGYTLFQIKISSLHGRCDYVQVALILEMFMFGNDLSRWYDARKKPKTAVHSTGVNVSSRHVFWF